MQKSKHPTAERVLTEDQYAHVFRVRCEVRNNLGVNWQYFDEADHRVTLNGDRSLSPEQFALNFRGRPVPDVLARLLDFQANTGPETYCAGFALTQDDGGLIKTFSTESAFLDSLYPFAQASGSGACYALWTPDGGELSSAIVVAFGEEGGAFAMAETFTDFLLMLGADRETSIWPDSVSFGTDEARSEYSGLFKRWLKDNFKLTANRSPHKLLKAAQTKHQKAFALWLSRFSR
jgi:hypothetical protein